jgi:hypothetical protein
VTDGGGKKPASAAYEADMMQRIGDWRTISPAEWVARNIHEYPLWGAGDYRFPTQEFDAWMTEADKLIFDIPGRRALRERFLTPEEIAAAEEYEAGPL